MWRRFPMPSPRIVGAAVLLVLGFGVAVGALAGSQADPSLASAAGQRRTILVTRTPGAPPPVTVTVTTTVTTPAPPPDTGDAATGSDSGSGSDSASGDGSSGDSASTPDSSPSAPATSTPARKKDSSTAPAEKAAAPFKHVWVVALTGHTMDEALATPSPMPYLSGTLRPKALLLSRYEAVAPGALANLIALLAGQPPTADQQAGCAAYTDVDAAGKTGCVYGAKVKDLPDQLAAVGKTWRGYVEGVDAIQPPDTCQRPAAGGALAPGMTRNPFLFFHAIVDTPDCDSSVAGLPALAADAQDAESAPSFSLVVATTPTDLPTADAWLKAQLDPLLASKAYADDGAIVVTFDAGPDPALPVGALVLAKGVKAGGTDAKPLDHFSLLRTIEDAFSLDPIGSAKDAKPIEITTSSR